MVAVVMVKETKSVTSRRKAASKKGISEHRERSSNESQIVPQAAGDVSWTLCDALTLAQTAALFVS